MEIKYNIKISSNIIVGEHERYLLDCIVQSIKKNHPDINENTGKVKLRERENNGEIEKVPVIGGFDGDNPRRYYFLCKTFKLVQQEDSQYKLVSVKRSR